MTNIQALIERRKKANHFLHLAYIRSDGWRLNLLVFRDFMEELPLTDSECFNIEDHLSANGLIKRRTISGVDGSFQLTLKGIRQVEDDVMSGEFNLKEVTALSNDETVPTAKAIIEQLSAEQEKRTEFLLRAYDGTVSGQGANLTFRKFSNALVLSESETFRIEDFLAGEFLIERVSGGGLDGWFSMTDWGMQAVEEALLSDESEETASESDITVHELTDENRPPWFPKTIKRRKKWARAWSIMREMKAEYFSEEAYYDGSPEPSDREYQDRISSEMQWKPSERLIRNIRRAGEEGLLDKYMQ